MDFNLSFSWTLSISLPRRRRDGLGAEVFRVHFKSPFLSIFLSVCPSRKWVFAAFEPDPLEVDFYFAPIYFRLYSCCLCDCLVLVLLFFFAENDISLRLKLRQLIWLWCSCQLNLVMLYPDFDVHMLQEKLIRRNLGKHPRKILYFCFAPVN